MSSNPQGPGKLIHIACCFQRGKGKLYLFLRQMSPTQYVWFERQGDGSEIATNVSGETIEEAMRNAQYIWKNDSFRTIICGFRYTLPERDEHGGNALFYQMAASYATPRGAYFDDELGHNCFVQSASQEALDWLDLLKHEGKLGMSK